MLSDIVKAKALPSLIAEVTWSICTWLSPVSINHACKTQGSILFHTFSFQNTCSRSEAELSSSSLPTRILQTNPPYAPILLSDTGE